MTAMSAEIEEIQKRLDLVRKGLAQMQRELAEALVRAHRPR